MQSTVALARQAAKITRIPSMTHDKIISQWSILATSKHFHLVLATALSIQTNSTDEFEEKQSLDLTGQPSFAYEVLLVSVL